MYNSPGPTDQPFFADPGTDLLGNDIGDERDMDDYDPALEDVWYREEVA